MLGELLAYALGRSHGRAESRPSPANYTWVECRACLGTGQFVEHLGARAEDDVIYDCRPCHGSGSILTIVRETDPLLFMVQRICAAIVVIALVLTMLAVCVFG